MVVDAADLVGLADGPQDDEGITGLGTTVGIGVTPVEAAQIDKGGFD